MGNKEDTKKILNNSLQVLGTLLQWAMALAVDNPGTTAGNPNHRSGSDDDEYEQLQAALYNSTKQAFANHFSYTFNGAHTIPPDWIKSAGHREARDDFVNVDINKRQLIDDYINNNVCQQAPDFCRDEVANDLIALLGTLLETLPDQGFTSTMFTKVYNDVEAESDKATKLDACFVYSQSDIITDGKKTKYLFMYFCGIYYPSGQWLNGMGPIVPQTIRNRIFLARKRV
ncbi:hypothetical protein GQ53DRAFT_758956 [Thozetella sp. PMI_491]|nr:hypothetical protein GQ53DRAFT_758956 [Thozetella sp. PMI_491]